MSDLSVQVLDKGFVRLVESLGDDSSIVQSARVSYGKGTKSVSEDAILIRYLMRHAHTTPFEMVTLKFHLKMPIFVARQWHRHRTASINEESARYSEMSDEFYIPNISEITTQSKDNKQGGTEEKVDNPVEMRYGFEFEQQSAFDSYSARLNSGMRKELARINMPLSAYTQFYWQMNLHNLFHFLKLRLDSHAQYEIRVYAEKIIEIVRGVCPVAVKAFEDYVLNSVTFSATEIQAMRAGHFRADAPASPIFSSKRELEEYLEKMNRLQLFQ